jgi:uncharacterized protein YyaL (SSP411 family)
LFKASRIFNNKKMEQAALKATNHYGERHYSMIEPYWGGTLDARAEDKEGAWAAFQGFLTAYEFTNNEQHLAWAKHACNVMLTYTVVWDITMPAGRMANHDFKTRGWTSVSVQNHHLDVFGVVTAPMVYRLGDYISNPRYKDLAVLMFRSCGQIIDPLVVRENRCNKPTICNMDGEKLKPWKMFVVVISRTGLFSGLLHIS